MAAKRLSMVSLGPGDTELLTLKALRTLRSCDAICVPTKSADRSFGRSLTHGIVTRLMEEHGFSRPLIPVYTPMKFRTEDWQHQVDVIEEQLREYDHLGFVTLGDSAIYSTVYYLLDLIQQQHPDLYAHSEVIPGVTSFSQASALAKKPLCVGESRLEIVPLLDKELPTTTVYMRPKIGMETTSIPEKGIMYTFEDLNFAGETITPHKIPVVRRYMTLLIDFFKKPSKNTFHSMRQVSTQPLKGALAFANAGVSSEKVSFLDEKFQREEPPINIGADISVRSFEIIASELTHYPKASTFDADQLAVISRLIHTTSCFDQVLDNIYFSPEALPRIATLLQNGAKIIVDVNMIKVGLSSFYLDTYGNETICYINEPFTYEHAKEHQTTRSYAAVVEAIKRHRDEAMVLVCGNAPTFIYAAINTLLDEEVDLSRVALLLFPVGFVNVVESKAYGRRFSEAFGVPAVIMEGRFGGSTMGVATLHAIYKNIHDYDGTTRYNGK